MANQNYPTFETHNTQARPFWPLSGIRSMSARLVHRALMRVISYRDRARQRAQLRGLDARLLDDVGLTRMQADLEAGKPFWRD